MKGMVPPHRRGLWALGTLQLLLYTVSCSHTNPTPSRGGVLDAHIPPTHTLHLRDHTIGAHTITSLDGDDWSASTDAHSGLEIPASVPGDIITDLEAAGVVGDPLYEFNFKDFTSFWSTENVTWTYTKHFSVAGAGNGRSDDATTQFLVLDGVS